FVSVFLGVTFIWGAYKKAHARLLCVGIIKSLTIGGTLDIFDNYYDSGEVITVLDNFTGQENIVTVGTIGTGTWQGTAVADEFIPDHIT
ncbi:unnamed protein product, partial [marine sediment metagenome]